MAQVINTNIPSLNSQRNLTSSQMTLATSLQRLSSGLRINSAKDDAAGLAIATRMSSQISGLNQAVRNANDGISLAQTGEGALGELTSSLQRIRELAVQSANATNSASDRAALQLEVNQRLAEIDRIAAQTSFNGQKILDGTFGNANFQIGANAGETISLALGASSNMRSDALGSIAKVTSTAITGATGSYGSVTTAQDVTLADWRPPLAAENGSATISAATLNFSGAPVAQQNGSVTFTFDPADGYDFSALPNGDVAGYNVQGFDVSQVWNATSSKYDFGGDNEIQFDITTATITTPIGITLGGEYATTNDIVAAIQAQIDAVDNTNGMTVSYNAGKLTFTSIGTGILEAVEISLVDDNAEEILGMTNSAGLAGVADGTGITFKVDGQAVVLDATSGPGGDGNVVDLDGLVTEIQSQLGGDYSVAKDGADIVITRAGTDESNVAAIDITEADSAAVQYGFATTSGSLEGTAGALGQTTKNAAFKVDGYEISLTTNYASFGAMATDLATKINAAYQTATSETDSPFSVAYDSDAGTFKITRAATADLGGWDPLAAIDIATSTTGDANEIANAEAAGFKNSITGTAGVAARTTSTKSFTVDGNYTVTLNSDYSADSSIADNLVQDIQDALDAQADGKYLVEADGEKLKISSTTSLTAPAVSASDFTFDPGVAGVASGINITSGNLTINGTAITADNYTGAELAARINSQVQGVYAQYDANTSQLSLVSASAITLGGSDLSDANALGGALSVGETAQGTGDSAKLKDVMVTTVADANLAISRVDSALATVSTMRSNFGAIQNRFDSTITNLSATVENLTASRSRIQDADFAQETANLTRAQILQQAGVAMLAQANALPNQVLTLLRG